MRILNSGLSLIESMICLAILSIIFTRLSMPGTNSWRQKVEIDGIMQELMASISVARSHAIAENVIVTLCRSEDGVQCGGRWNNGYIVFTDWNANRVMDGRDRILSRATSFQEFGSLTYNSFQNRQYLQITPRGFTDFQNGNFTFCSLDGVPENSRQIIVSLSGRARYARDTDGDGIVENSQGKPVFCG
ncbi:MAG: hypothetical protein A3H44_04705 [Gammaproteobacteria bacterium RIFCSPLOWO2_02_FULL_57_10]|nr:MAG: hypothetical protein A3H44_04705 [Gammaproteobacteria bacterium RIFCSPLOWO2_02_FULL_57_10]